MLNHLIALAQDNVVTVRVTFPGNSRWYTYKARKDWNIAEGDSLVVDSPNSGLAVVTVVEVDDFADIDVSKPWTYKWAVCKVDRTFYNEIQAQEAAARAELAELERKAKRNKALLKAAEETGLSVEDLQKLLASHFKG